MKTVSYRVYRSMEQYFRFITDLPFSNIRLSQETDSVIMIYIDVNLEFTYLYLMTIKNHPYKMNIDMLCDEMSLMFPYRFYITINNTQHNICNRRFNDVNLSLKHI